MDLIPDFTFPIWAIAIEPVPLDNQHRPIIEELQFSVISDDHDTPLIIIFTTQMLVSMCFNESPPAWDYRTIEIQTNDQLLYIMKILRIHYQKPVGVLRDPDGNLQGFPLPPQQWSDSATE